MVRYLAKKCVWHLAVGLLGYIAVAALASRMHAGWFAGFLGACYLLAGWVCWMKGDGTDLPALMRRKRPPEVPYYLRGVDKTIKPKLGIGGNRHTFEDEEDAPSNLPPEELSPKGQLRLRGVSLALVGLLFLLLSFF